jgi:23S rRNA (cytidine1920-2'-O)/16S rRNA (cytidine1409-2'-O)-methyltransferase
MSSEPSPSRRADLALVERGLFPSRAKAQEAIAAGLVAADGRRVAKPSEPVALDAKIVAAAPYPWVSRGGVKLAAALDRFGLDPARRACLDIGASTGGFTEVLLARGAASVTAVDVGRGQLHPRLAADARVRRLEATDARRLTPDLIGMVPDMIVCDVSFISLRLVLPHVLALAAPAAALVALVKPQFEVGPAHVVKGLVRDDAARDKACADVRACVAALGWQVLGLMPSPIAGGDGNREYLLAARAP